MNPPILTFGVRVLQARTAKRLSRRELAEMVEVATDTIGRVERNRGDVARRTAARICAALELPPETLSLP